MRTNAQDRDYFLTHLPYVDRGLMTWSEYWYLYNLYYFRELYQQGMFDQYPGQAVTRRKSKCDLCRAELPPGSPKFILLTTRSWYRFHYLCLDKIKQILPLKIGL